MNDLDHIQSMREAAHAREGESIQGTEARYRLSASVTISAEDIGAATGMSREEISASEAGHAEILKVVALLDSKDHVLRETKAAAVKCSEDQEAERVRVLSYLQAVVKAVEDMVGDQDARIDNGSGVATLSTSKLRHLIGFTNRSIEDFGKEW